jgi:ABC-type dipeptide/oligopeptide/nickel transport system permease component
MLTGIVIVEGIYDIPGVGNLILDSVARRDRAVVVGGVLVISVIAIVGAVAADIAAAALDPRLRLEGEGPS